MVCFISHREHPLYQKILDMNIIHKYQPNEQIQFASVKERLNHQIDI